jgi:hypothetical protein
MISDAAQTETMYVNSRHGQDRTRHAHHLIANPIYTGLCVRLCLINTLYIDIMCNEMQLYRLD